MLPQDEALEILNDFLQHFGYAKVDMIDLTTIKELARMVLQENVFAYGKKYINKQRVVLWVHHLH